MLKSRNVRNYLEIGARHGDALAWVIEHLRPQRVTVVELPESKWGHKGSLDNLQAVIGGARGQGVDVELILGNSTDPAVIAATARRGPFDAIFIDGDHTLQGVTADWQNYAPMSRDIVAFHDIFGTKCAWGSVPVEVPKLWSKIKAQFEVIEIGSAASRMGIGVAFKGDRKDMNSKGINVAIYGDDTEEMAEIARQLRIDGHSVLVRNLGKWQEDTESVQHVLLLREHDRLVAAYAAKGVPVELVGGALEDESDGPDQPSEVDEEPAVKTDNAADDDAQNAPAAAKPKRNRKSKA